MFRLAAIFFGRIVVNFGEIANCSYCCAVMNAKMILFLRELNSFNPDLPFGFEMMVDAAFGQFCSE